GTILDYLADQVLFPDLDVRERLSLNKGYRIVEIPVLAKSPLAKKALGDTGLREQEVVVLSITRGSITLPNPPTTEKILPGDLLLCFGKQLVLKGLMPKKRKQLKEEPLDEAIPVQTPTRSTPEAGTGGTPA